MSLFSCTFLSLGFFLLIASIHVLAMDDPNDPDHVWFPTSHLVPFDQTPIISLNALPEQSFPIPKPLVNQGRDTDDSSSESHPITPESSSGTQERGTDPNDWPKILYPKAGAPDEAVPSSSGSRSVAWSHPSDGAQHKWGQDPNLPALSRTDHSLASGSQPRTHSTTPFHPSSPATPIEEASGSALGGVAPSTSSSAFLTLDGKPVPWTSEQPTPKYEIPVFKQHPGGRLWGPYVVGEEKFRPVTYPLHIPVFRHLYDNDGIEFQNFENLYRQGQFRASGIRFRPEPLALEAIQQKIWTSLKEKQQLEPGIVRDDTALQEGEYLWPPVHPSDVNGRLHMPSNTLLSKLRMAITSRLGTHDQHSPRLYHITVKINSQDRHFLMFSPNTGAFIHHWVENLGPRPWAFLQSYKEPASGTRDRLALAGLTFLPHHSDVYLREAGIITPAFMQALHP